LLKIVQAIRATDSQIATIARMSGFGGTTRNIQDTEDRWIVVIPPFQQDDHA